MSTENNKKILPPGTVVVDSETNEIKIHDGRTTGGLSLSTGNEINAEPEEEFTINVRYSLPSSPPSLTPNYISLPYTFGNDGFLEVPTGIRSNSNLGIRATGAIAIGVQNPAPPVRIGLNGRITLSAAVPASSIGSPGDGTNMIAFDANYIYICTGFWDGTSNIWKRVPLPGGAW